ncbi:translation initiation factor IF-2-like isoform X2 [Gopherus evgoodei]|uniref:translation initiation factor IF-2-like isoform X2 n=1 Tax=Gopherus evgoodei TaxID=1825980 RepID=UPI0011CF622F|nr:translation initiation factor IF-2-like isoform X2 [Gopherus evgoodei]
MAAGSDAPAALPPARLARLKRSRRSASHLPVALRTKALAQLLHHHSPEPGSTTTTTAPGLPSPAPAPPAGDPNGDRVELALWEAEAAPEPAPEAGPGCEELTLDHLLEIVAQLEYHTHPEDGVEICPLFLLGCCFSGACCPQHHTLLPYHWQLWQTASLPPGWLSVGPEAHETLERLYSDPERTLVRASYRGVAFDIDLVAMQVRNSPSFTRVRRLGTSPAPGAPFGTSHVYYWRALGGWQPYSQDALRQPVPGPPAGPGAPPGAALPRDLGAADPRAGLAPGARGGGGARLPAHLRALSQEPARVAVPPGAGLAGAEPLPVGQVQEEAEPHEPADVPGAAAAERASPLPRDVGGRGAGHLQTQPGPPAVGETRRPLRAGQLLRPPGQLLPPLRAPRRGRPAPRLPLQGAGGALGPGAAGPAPAPGPGPRRPGQRPVRLVRGQPERPPDLRGLRQRPVLPLLPPPVPRAGGGGDGGLTGGGGGRTQESCCRWRSEGSSVIGLGWAQQEVMSLGPTRLPRVQQEVMSFYSRL